MLTSSPKKPMLILLSAASGAGKSTIARKLLENDQNLSLSISITSRNIRNGEKYGTDYIFVTHEDFEKQIAIGELLEYTEIYGNYYGTPKKQIAEKLEAGLDVLFDIDVQGAYNLQQKIPDRCVSIFILAPNLATLKERLKNRKRDSIQEIDLRSELAAAENANAKNYDYQVVNDDLEVATKEILTIIQHERKKRM